MAKTPSELDGKSVFVAGHRGMVGSALVRRLARELEEPSQPLISGSFALLSWRVGSQSRFHAGDWASSLALVGVVAPDDSWELPKTIRIGSGDIEMKSVQAVETAVQFSRTAALESYERLAEVLLKTS
jgi:hypothetical protein